MTLYRYKAIGKGGILQKGVLEASSLIHLKARLGDEGFSLITCSRKFSCGFSQKIKPRVLMDFCLQLEQFERAGIPLKEGLEELHRAQTMPRPKALLSEILKDVEGGLLFSKALAKHPSIFDPLFVGLVTVGETIGSLSFVFHQLFHHLKWTDDVHTQIFKALRYPLIMASVLGLVLIILMIVLVPELVTFIKPFTPTLPFSTRLLISVSTFLSTYLWLLICPIGIVCLFLRLFFKFHQKGPLWKEHLLEAVPFFGPLRKNLALAQFFHIFAVMFESNIDILETLQTARKSLKHGHLCHVLKKVEIFIREGCSLSTAFQRVDFFPSLVIRMTKIGEQTSSLQKTLLHIKDYFDTSFKRQVDYTVELIQPVMILSVGGIMAWIICSIFLPLYTTLSILEY